MRVQRTVDGTSGICFSVFGTMFEQCEWVSEKETKFRVFAVFVVAVAATHVHRRPTAVPTKQTWKSSKSGKTALGTFGNRFFTVFFRVVLVVSTMLFVFSFLSLCLTDLFDVFSCLFVFFFSFFRCSRFRFLHAFLCCNLSTFIRSYHNDYYSFFSKQNRPIWHSIVLCCCCRFYPFLFQWINHSLIFTANIFLQLTP